MTEENVKVDDAQDESTVEGEEVESTVEASGDLDTNEEEVGHGFPTEDDAGTETVEEDETPARVSFADRAESMGLTPSGEGCYSYADPVSEVAYRTLRTQGGADILDGYEVAQLAVLTRLPEGEWKQIGIVSQLYQFVGNSALIDSIKSAIEEAGSPIYREETYQASNLAQIRHEIIVQNATNVPNVGDIYPLMIVGNGYDGTKAANISFGLFFSDSDDINITFGSKKKFGSLRQVHIEGASTELSSSLGEYVTAFGANIADMIAANFTNTITPEDMMRSLDLIEKQAGKRRRDAISTIISEQHGEEELENLSITSWNLFHAITKFSTVERNLNAKLLLEDMAERVLVVPAQMLEALAEINA